MTIKAKVPSPKSGLAEDGRLPLRKQSNGKFRVMSKEDQVFLNLYKAVEKDGMFDRMVEGMKRTDIAPEVVEMCEVVIANMRATEDLETKRKLFNFIEVIIGYYATNKSIRPSELDLA